MIVNNLSEGSCNYSLYQLGQQLVSAVLLFFPECLVFWLWSLRA